MALKRKAKVAQHCYLQLNKAISLYMSALNHHAYTQLKAATATAKAVRAVEAHAIAGLPARQLFTNEITRARPGYGLSFYKNVVAR